MKVLIVIASFADSLLDGMLESIKEHTKDIDYEIQVVDNHKDTKKLEVTTIPICKKHNVPLHLDNTLLGYSHVLNTGVEVSDSESEYVCYISPDVLVKEGWLKEMVDCFERNKENGCSLVGPLVKDFDGSYLPGIMEHYGQPKDIIGKDLLIEAPFYLNGVCILQERKTIPEFKWDKNYHRAYWEDNDFTEQVRFWGGKIYVAGKSLILHKVNASHDTILKETGNTASAVGASNRKYYTFKWTTVQRYINTKGKFGIRDVTLGTCIELEK